jgi:hypothetical protein
MFDNDLAWSIVSNNYFQFFSTVYP